MQTPPWDLDPNVDFRDEHSVSGCKKISLAEIPTEFGAVFRA